MHFQQYKGMSNEEARLQQSAVPTGSEKRYVPPESMRKVEEKIMREANEKVTRNQKRRDEEELVCHVKCYSIVYVYVIILIVKWMVTENDSNLKTSTEPSTRIVSSRSKRILVKRFHFCFVIGFVNREKP